MKRIISLISVLFLSLICLSLEAREDSKWRFSVGAGGGVLNYSSKDIFKVEDQQMKVAGFKGEASYQLPYKSYLSLSSNVVFNYASNKTVAFFNQAIRYDATLSVGKTFNPVSYFYVSPYIGLSYNDNYYSNESLSKHFNMLHKDGEISKADVHQYIKQAKRELHGPLQGHLRPVAGSYFYQPLSEKLFFSAGLNYDLQILHMFNYNPLTISQIQVGATYVLEEDALFDTISIGYRFVMLGATSSAHALAIELSL